MSAEQHKENSDGQVSNSENSNSQVSNSGPSSVEEKIQEAYDKLPSAGKFVYDRTMEYALKGQFVAAVSSYVEDMNNFDKVVGFDNCKKLESHVNDIKQFQLCVLGLIQEAGFQ